MFTLVPLNDATILSSNSFVLNTVGDGVDSQELFSVDVNGIYLQFSLPAVTASGNVLSVGFGGSPFYLGYYLELTATNSISFEFVPQNGPHDVIVTTTYTPGDIASLYYDGTNMFFYLGGTLVGTGTQLITGLHGFRCQYNATIDNQTYQFDNVSIFVTGKKGADGEAGTTFSFLGIPWVNSGGPHSGLYYRNEVVLGSNGNSYVCIETDSAETTDPITSPSDQWRLFAERGLQGPTGTIQLGNVLLVDQVYGDDGLASIGGLPYQTVEAALFGTSGTTGTTVWVMPGTYNLTHGITLSDQIALRGLNTQTCTLQMLGVTGNTTLLKMGENCRVEDLTLKLTSSEHHTLTGIAFEGTSTQTSKLRTSVLTVDNSGANTSGSSNVYGVVCGGTGPLTESTFSFNSIKGSTINVKSNGSGSKRGILVNGTNQVSTRDTNIYVATPLDSASAGSYVGVETANPGAPGLTGSIQLRATSIHGPKQSGSYTSSDILQSFPPSITNPTYLASGGIQIGPGVDLVNKAAGTKPFSTYVYPTTIFFCGKGTASNNAAGYLWPGTVAFAGGGNAYPDVTTPVARYRVQQPAILSGLSVSCNSLTNPDTVTVTVCKGATGGSLLSNPTVFTVTLTSVTPSLSKTFYDGSKDFAVGDYLNVYMDVNGNSLQDLAVQVDMF
jgi:hypothetical protein